MVTAPMILNGQRNKYVMTDISTTLCFAFVIGLSLDIC